MTTRTFVPGIANYRQIDKALELRVTFKGNSMSARDEGSKYVVYSYATPIASYDRETGEVWTTDRYYSATTSKHLGHVRRHLDRQAA